MHRNRQGRSPSPPHPDDTPRAGSSGSPPLPSVPQGSSVSESIPPEHAAATSSTTGALTDPNPYPMYSPHAVATRSSFISVAVPVRPSTHTILDTSAVRTSTPLQPRHSSEGSVQLDSTVGLVPASGSPPPQPPPSTTKPTFTTLPEHVYNPRGDFYQPLNSPGVTTQAGSSSQAPFPPPHVPRPVRARSQHVARSRISLGNGNGEHDPNAEAGGAVSWIVPEKPSPVVSISVSVSLLALAFVNMT